MTGEDIRAPILEAGHLFEPFRDQGLTSMGMPVEFEIGMALRPQSRTRVVTKTTFQGLVSRTEQFTTLVFQKRASVPCKGLGGEGAFTSTKGWRQHAKGSFGG